MRQGLLFRPLTSAAGALLLLLTAASCVSIAAAQQQQQASAQGPATEAAGTGAASVGANATTASNSTSDTYSLIVVFKDAATLAKQKVMCGRSALLFRLFAPGLRLSADCHMPNVCRRFYTRTLLGFYGVFTTADVEKLERCLPGAIYYAEPDGTVHKAEDDDDFWHPEGASLEQRLTKAPDWHAQRPATVAFQAAAAAASRGLGAGRRGMQEGSPAARRISAQRSPVAEAAASDPGLRVTAFEQSNRTSGGNGGAINLQAFSSVPSPGQKQQTLTPPVPAGRLWNLDRMDQRELPLDNLFFFGGSGFAGVGTGATVYVVDSGIRPSHQEFMSWDGTRSRASYGFDFVEDDSEAQDCDGHGTHVAATAIGLQVGVAKDANVVAVRILDCTGSGTISDTVAGLDWVAANHKKPAIVTLSLGIQVGSWSRVLEDSVRSLVNDHGITVVVASGNSAVDSCYVAPANVPEVISVAASNLATKYTGSKMGDTEDMYKWSNTGTCVDIFAPGVDIYSACGGATRCESVTDTAYTYASGTSMAVPAVAGVAAVYLGQQPSASPARVAQAIIGASTPNKVNPSLFKPGTANRLLYSRIDPGSSGGMVQAADGPPASPGAERRP